MFRIERKIGNTLLFRFVSWGNIDLDGDGHRRHPPCLTPPPLLFPAAGALIHEKKGRNESES
jgi:hypothetical protein